MLAIERRNEILEKLQNDRRVVVSELSQIYEVSEETIRRDLDKLVQDGFAIKSYGGAVINENVNIELPFNIRKNRNIVGKQHIAELVSEQIKDGVASCLMQVLQQCMLQRRFSNRERRILPYLQTLWRLS